MRLLCVLLSATVSSQVNEKGQVTLSKETPFKDMETEIVEETGLKCCICLEGYKNQPQKVLDYQCVCVCCTEHVLNMCRPCSMHVTSSSMHMYEFNVH